MLSYLILSYLILFFLILSDLTPVYYTKYYSLKCNIIPYCYNSIIGYCSITKTCTCTSIICVLNFHFNTATLVLK